MDVTVEVVALLYFLRSSARACFLSTRHVLCARLPTLTPLEEGEKR